MQLLTLYQHPALSKTVVQRKLETLEKIAGIKTLDVEYCYYVELTATSLSPSDLSNLKWVLGNPLFNGEDLSETSKFIDSLVVEIGPRLNFSTAFSTNAVSICSAIGLSVTRIERATRYCIETFAELTPQQQLDITNALHDRMTECRYLTKLKSFNHGITPEPWYAVDILKSGQKALEDVNSHLGLAFDDWDLEYYTRLFQDQLKRNPTSVECFDLAQSNSEHSRHWFFRGKLFQDGTELPKSLFQYLMATQEHSNDNNVIKFSDNSSAIQGYELQAIMPSKAGTAGAFKLESMKKHIIFTAETHNFPTGVAPFSGAGTGTGGRIRDVQAVGRGGHVIAGTAAYCFGNLLIPGYDLAWEDKQAIYPSNFATPLTIAIEASNGASDYGNKFGEPIISGFARSFGQTLSDGQRREWIKPIMFTGGIGSIEDDMITKMTPEEGMEVVKLGGPIYRIGVGGGAASSLQVQGDNKVELDFGAVQRGDPEMEQKMNRVIRACLELRGQNPICSIHDQGAGGNGNVLKEICEPVGAKIYTKEFQLGDTSIGTMELWGAEYQESNALLCRKEDKPLLKSIAKREKCPVDFVGEITNDGRVVLVEASREDSNLDVTLHPVDLELELVLGKMPQKEFHMNHEGVKPKPIQLPNVTVEEALTRVLRLPAVASKRYLTNKVDRCVTGLIAQQQCVGPLHTPLADVAVIALSHFGVEGSATSIGEQPIKGLVKAAAGARMALAEALTNLVFAPITDIKDVKCSGNWMWAAKLPGEGALLVDACLSLCEAMEKVGVAIDGGKDSLSMAARVDGQVVKAPGSIVVSAYAPCPDFRKVITPDLKLPSVGQRGAIFLVDLSRGQARLGGSALAQCYQQLGNSTPDLDECSLLVNMFEATQQLIAGGSVTAGHDISDGGLVTCLLEMAIAGVCGIRINLEAQKDVRSGSALEILFSEELGIVLEAKESQEEQVLTTFAQFNVPCVKIGYSEDHSAGAKVEIVVDNQRVVNRALNEVLFDWEETSFQLERLQANPKCVLQEFQGLQRRKGPSYKLSFDMKLCNIERPIGVKSAHRVAVWREEGTNGDREMAASLLMAGFEVWDITTTDLLQNTVALDRFRGIIFPGGFSYADVLGSAKGWAASLLFHTNIRAQLDHFRKRQDTFSLGVCNGCQLMALLGWMDPKNGDDKLHSQVVLEHNESGRFESRFSTVRIEESSSILLKGMQGSVLGVWVAHGEGRFAFRDEQVLTTLASQGCVALKYVDDDAQPTQEYPMNPNGSPSAIAGLCSSDGRFLALMPHPERCVLPWQWPYMPFDWERGQYSPWIKLFDNAFQWCDTKP